MTKKTDSANEATRKKPWYKSRTIMGALATAALGVMASFDIHLPVGEEEAAGGLLALGTLVSLAVTIYGRIRATQPIQPLRPGNGLKVLLIGVMLAAALGLWSCSTSGGSSADELDITTSRGARIQGKNVKLGQDIAVHSTASGDVYFNVTTTAYHVQLDAQEKAMLIQGFESLQNLGAKALAGYFTGGTSEAAAFLKTLAKTGNQLREQNPEK